jgi:serine/threonine protein kinase
LGNTFDALNQLPRPFGPFTLIRLIAQGGMGQVFLALRPVEGESTDEVCVVKTVRTDLKNDKEAIGRFLDEARVVQKLDHAAICHTLDAGIVEKTYFLALEFISGRNLRDVQTRAQKIGKPLPNELIFHAISEVLSSLSYAHSLVDKDTGKPLGIVHRDISPHNVMLGFDGYVKLIDFGLAAHGLKRELTRPGIMVGKLRYNAPEQVRDRAMDGRSDLYSVGVMLYELLTGERFYEGLTEEAVWRVAMSGDHKPQGYDRLPADVRNVLDLALAPEPEGRFPSAADMRDAVIELASSRVVREGRRQSARFMSEIFAEERVTEREMILQATGLAEARTRLFDPSKKVHADSDLSESSHSNVGRHTAVVSPAQIRGRLQDLVSGFDPDAETQMPTRPLIEERRGPEEPGVEGASAFRSSGKMKPAPRAQSKGSRSGSVASASDRTVVRAPDNPFNEMISETEAADDTLAQKVGVSATDPLGGKQSTRSSLKRRSQPTRTTQADGYEPLPPLAPGPSSAKLLAAGVMGGVVVLIVVAIAVLVGLKSPLANDGKTRGGGDDPNPAVVDAGSPRVVMRVDPPAQPDAGFAEVVPPVVVDAGFAEVVQPVVADAGFAEATPTQPDKKRPKKQPVEKPRPPPPPEFKTLKAQVDYLEKYCLERVACARSAVSDAKNLATLSPEETKGLIAEIPRCIARCRE